MRKAVSHRKIPVKKKPPASFFKSDMLRGEWHLLKDTIETTTSQIVFRQGRQLSSLAKAKVCMVCPEGKESPPFQPNGAALNYFTICAQSIDLRTDRRQ
jgi:hypothetical protein